MADINSTKQNIIANLNAIINYNYNSESFAILKDALRELLSQLEDAMKTKEGIQLWQFKLEHDLSKLGEPQYTGGDPYSGGFPELVQTPENIMRKFVHTKIELCKQDAARIRSMRDDEERKLMPTIAGTETRVRAFLAPIEALKTWKETSGLEEKYSGKRLLAYANSVVELSKPAFYYLRGMGPRPTTPQVRTIIEELEESANFTNDERCIQEVSDIDRHSWMVQVLACVPLLKAYVDYVDHTASSTLPWREAWTPQYPTYVPTPASTLRESEYPRNSPHHPSQTAYVAYTDPEQSQSLPWKNGLTRMQTAEERTGKHRLPPQAHIQTLLLRMQKLLS